jgi:hypothetical protein
VTGATNAEFEPMNAPAPMSVLNLQKPSQLQVIVPASMDGADHRGRMAG